MAPRAPPLSPKRAGALTTSPSMLGSRSPGKGGAELRSDVTVPRRAGEGRAKGRDREVAQLAGADAGWLSSQEPGRSEPGEAPSLRIASSARLVVAGRWAWDAAQGQGRARAGRFTAGWVEG